jgi:predicted nucleic acid-binding protein
MKGKYFLDTNILIYTFDFSSPEKQARAQNLVSNAIEHRQGVIGFQVIQEFFNVATRKFKKPLNYRDCAAFLESVLAPLCEVFPTIELYREALDIRERWKLSYYDSLMVAAALNARCSTLYSEDLQHGMKIKDLIIENPFLP